MIAMTIDADKSKVIIIATILAHIRRSLIAKTAPRREYFAHHVGGHGIPIPRLCRRRREEDAAVCGRRNLSMCPRRRLAREDDDVPGRPLRTFENSHHFHMLIDLSSARLSRLLGCRMRRTIDSTSSFVDEDDASA